MKIWLPSGCTTSISTTQSQLPAAALQSPALYMLTRAASGRSKKITTGNTVMPTLSRLRMYLKVYSSILLFLFECTDRIAPPLCMYQMFWKNLHAHTSAHILYNYPSYDNEVRPSCNCDPGSIILTVPWHPMTAPPPGASTYDDPNSFFTLLPTVWPCSTCMYE